MSISASQQQTTKKRAVLYARVSSDDRRRDGRNLSGQLDMCREYAEKQGWKVIAELAEDDRGASGAEFELPMLNQALDMAASGEYDILVTREIDRLARGLAKQLVVERQLLNSGVKIEYVLGDYPDTPEGNLLKNVRAVIAEYERLKIKERMARGRRLKIERGSVITHGLAPYGYRRVENGHQVLLEINDKEADIVRLIYDWYASEVGVTDIVRRLESMGIPTPAEVSDKRTRKKKGRTEWARSTIYQILRSETYAGRWQYGKGNVYGQRHNGDLPEVRVPAIIGRALWNDVQQKIERNRKHAPSRAKYDYLLSGRFFCEECGALMSAVSTKNRGRVYLYYRCPTKAQKYARNCSAPRCRADHVDAAVWQCIKQLLSNPEELQRGLDAMREKQEQINQPLIERLRVIDDLLAEHERQLGRWLDLYLDDQMPKELMIDRKKRLEETIEKLEAEKAEKGASLMARSLTPEEVEGIKQFAGRIALGFEEIEEEDFEVQRWILNKLSLTGRFYVTEEGEKRVRVECILGESDLSVVSNLANMGSPPTCRWT